MCIECGYKKDFTQWVEIHLMLSSLHDVLLQTCASNYEKAYNESQKKNIGFWDYVHIFNGRKNDEVTRFWAELLNIEHIY